MQIVRRLLLVLLLDQVGQSLQSSEYQGVTAGVGYFA
jgi:hypothetical protein